MQRNHANSATHTIALAKTDAEISRCYPVIHELRPHLSAADFLNRAKHQMAQGYRLAFLEAEGEIRSVAGYRTAETLCWGKFLYVDDLVTRTADQRTGYGGKLFDWLLAEAAREACEQLHLDSGVQRFGAHRFYLNKGMDITSHHFALKLV